jgi:hypothetical protein
MTTLWILLAVCVLPFAASFGLYYLAPPDSRMNYGELLTPAPLPSIQGMGLDGKPEQLDRLRGKWVLLQVDSGDCDRRCVTKLYKMRQVRQTQNKNINRVERAWLVSDERPVDPNLLKYYEGTVVLRAGASSIARFPAAGDVRDHIWLIDPLGNLVLRYPPDADPTGMKNDLMRLLKVSQIG